MLYLFFFDIRVDTPRLCALFVPLVAIPPPVASSFSCPQLPCPHAPRCPVLVHLVASVSCLSLPASVFCLHGIALTSRFNTTTLGYDPGAASQGRQEHARTPLDSVMDLVKHTAFYMHQRSTEPDVVSSEQGQRR